MSNLNRSLLAFRQTDHSKAYEIHGHLSKKPSDDADKAL